MARRPRFAPPPLARSAELEWVLLRAFAPREAAAPSVVDGAEILRLANALDVASRIGSRVPRSVLEAELGDGAAAALLEDYHATAAANLVALAVAREVADIAARHSIPVAFLKSTALLLSGATDIGTRNASDLDVLVGKEDISQLRAALRAGGYVGGGDSHKEHQLAPMYHASGVMIEVHRAVKGLRPGGAWRWAGLREYRDLGVLLPVRGHPPGTYVPSPPVLAAHAMIHGIVQHGAHPGTYPHLRVVGDLVDLERDADSIDEAILHFWAGRTIRPSEASSLLMFSRRLAMGDAGAALGDEAASWWLRHTLGCLDDVEYREYLRILGIIWDEANAPAGAMMVKKVVRAIFPSRAGLEARYGRVTGTLPRFGLLVWRPLSLVGRVTRYCWFHLRYRRRHVVSRRPANSGI